MKKLFIFVWLFILVSCAKTYDPLTGKHVYTLLPEEKELELGELYVPLAIDQNDGRYPDKEVQQYVVSIGKKIEKVVPRKLPYEFFVVNSPIVNAFALPGGKIFVNIGLLYVLENESQLAGVIGHELAHVNARHHARFLEKQYGIAILFNILAILLANQKSADIFLQFGKIGAQLLTLKYSRDQEREADRLGVKFAYEAGYDPTGLLETFLIFKKLGNTNAPEWLLTHPLPENRYKEIKKLLSKYDLSKKHLIKDTKQFHYIKNKVLKYKKSYDLMKEAKTLISKKKYNQSLNLLNQSIKIYPQNNASLTYRAIIYTIKRDYKKAYKDAKKALEIDPMFFKPHLIAGISLNRLKNYRESLTYLEKAKELIPSFPDTYYYLGLDYEYLGDYKKAIENYQMALKLSDGKRGWEADAKRRLIRLKKLLYY
ncbi:MAG: M48 family metalloprotease [Aquificae bacterium]|nr:M48 family metalloprotease [Aquificota bacterium]